MQQNIQESWERGFGVQIGAIICEFLLNFAQFCYFIVSRKYIATALEGFQNGFEGILQLHFLNPAILVLFPEISTLYQQHKNWNVISRNVSGLSKRSKIFANT